MRRSNFAEVCEGEIAQTTGKAKKKKTPPLQHPNLEPPPAGEVGESPNREGVQVQVALLTAVVRIRYGVSPLVQFRKQTLEPTIRPS